MKPRRLPMAKYKKDKSRYAGKAPFPGLEDGRQASEVRPINANSEQYDMDKIRWNSVGSKGYPSQAFDYEY